MKKNIIINADIWNGKVKPMTLTRAIKTIEMPRMFNKTINVRLKNNVKIL